MFLAEELKLILWYYTSDKGNKVTSSNMQQSKTLQTVTCKCSEKKKKKETGSMGVTLNDELLLQTLLDWCVFNETRHLLHQNSVSVWIFNRCICKNAVSKKLMTSWMLNTLLSLSAYDGQKQSSWSPKAAVWFHRLCLRFCVQGQILHLTNIQEWSLLISFNLPNTTTDQHVGLRI